MKASPTILVIGATGRYGSLVLPALASRGAVVRALVREQRRTDDVIAAGAREIALGDLRDPQSLQAALTGVDGVFYLAPMFAPDQVAMGLRLINAAVAAGVQRFVFSSVIHPSITALENHRAKPPVEEALYLSGMEYVVLQPAVFYQNIKAPWSSIMDKGIFAEPFRKTSKLARVDYRDVAEAAALALTQEDLVYGTFELCGCNLDRVEIADIMGDVLDRKIVAETVTFEQWSAAAKSITDENHLDQMRNIFAKYDAQHMQGNALTLRAVLGREPRSMRTFIEDLAQASW